MSHKQTIISSALANECDQCKDSLTSYSNGIWKEGATCRTLGQKVKFQPYGDFLVALIFWQDILTHLGQCFFLLCTQIQYDETNKPRTF